ncbi:inosine triphosphate pyrophosphatase-like protein [Haematococcus lacustris]
MLLPHLGLLNQRKIVLASASPRRQQLLQQLHLNFEVVVSNFEELLPKAQFSGPEGAARYAVETAKGKVLDVVAMARQDAAATGARLPDLVIGADTVVEHQGIILEKADSPAAAADMLSRLSGDSHQVHTGVVLALPNRSEVGEATGPLLRCFHCSTRVEFEALDAALIQDYIQTGEPFGKAGSYGIQGVAGSFVKGIQGCYFNVMGFPLHRFSKEVVLLIQEGLLH